MNTVIFADGTALECPYFAYSPTIGRLYITFPFSTYGEVMEFITPEKLERIEYQGETIEGYTDVVYLKNDVGGIRICLKEA